MIVIHIFDKAWKSFAILLVLMVLLTLIPLGCANPKKVSTGDKLDIVATIFPPFDFARELGGEHVDVTMLLPPGVESHSYEPTPKEVVRIATCDLFIYNGGVSDSWVERLIQAAEIDSDKAVRMMDFVALVEESEDGVLEHDHDDHAHEIPHLHEFDEHIWTSPMNALLIAEGIYQKLIEIDPAHAKDYEENFTRYRTELRAIDEAFRDVIREGKRKEIIVADRFPLIYFTSEYELDYLAAFPGCAAETDPKPRTVSAIIEKVREEQIPYIFHIEFSNEKLADLIAEETGAQKLLFHTAHNVSKTELQEGISYLSIMRNNVESLKWGLDG